MNGNDFVKFLLRSPLHGMMSGGTLLITVTGRKSGKEITTPVNYVADGTTLWVISKRDRTWWRNVKGGAPVRVRVRGRDLPARAEALLDEPAVATHLATYVSRSPLSARSLGVRLENGVPDAGDLARVARDWLMVRVLTD